MFDTPPRERKKDEESETRVRMNCHSGKVKRVVIRRAWKTQRHTHTHTPRTGAHPSSGLLFSKARESKARPRTKRSWIPSTAHFGGPGLYGTLPSSSTTHAALREPLSKHRDATFTVPPGRTCPCPGPQNFRRRLLHDVRCWNPAPKRDGTGRPWSAISWTRLASPVHSGQRPLAGRDS